MDLTQLSWTPSIGDPTYMGWVTVMLYGATAVSLFYRGLSERNGKNKRWLSWLCISCLFLFLTINKQLDLQSLMTEVLKLHAIQYDWYQNRRAFQLFFIAGLITTSLMLLGAFIWLNRGHLRQFGLVAFGLIFLLTFILIRASSFHHMDALISLEMFTIRMNWVLEITGIMLVFIGSLWRQSLAMQKS